MSLTEQSTTTLQTQYSQVRQQTEKLCAPLQTEDYVPQPIEDVSPPKWHLGHTTWFFEQFVLVPYANGYQLFDADFAYLFNSYYESVGERVVRAHRGFLTRPSVEQVYAYRHHVDQAMQVFFEQEDGWPANLFEVITIGLNHEQQHQELLLTDLKYILGHNPLLPAYQKDAKPRQNSPVNGQEWYTVPEGVYEIGHEGNGFCFDNELGRHKVYLNEFQCQSRLVTNREYHEFMQAGGYTQFQHWLAEGWAWVQENNIRAPLYWYEAEGAWQYYTLTGLREPDWNAAVTHVNFYEADAFARWSDRRLLTEAEWEVACSMHSPEIPQAANFVEDEQWQPMPAFSNQFYGDVWEWTNSAYLPYPGYQAAPGALGEYNGKFMINQMVLRGGSCATPRSHIRATYRNFFHADKRWQFTGIRLAQVS